MTRTISLCLIARDEEELLPGCLASVRGAVDEIIVVDTGSADRTREVARAAGARVAERPWDDDFAAPRNLAASLARGDYVLQLDADERLAPGAAGELRAAATRGGFDAGVIRLHNAARLDAAPGDVISGAARLGSPVELARLFRRTDDLRWEGVVHESPSAWLAGRGMQLAPVNADVVHLGYVPELRAARAKAERNVRLLRRRCELEPDSVTPFGALALELTGQGRMDEAAEVSRRGWALLDAQPRDRSILRLAVARALAALREGDAAAALDAVERGEVREGACADLHALRGRALLLRASGRADPRPDAALAAAAFRGALGAGPAPRQFLDGAASYGSREGLAVALLVLGDAGAALEQLDAARTDAPDDLDVRLAAAEALLDLGDAAGALALLEALAGGSRDAWLLAAAAAAALGHAGDARALLARASAGPWRSPHRRRREAALAAALPR